MRRLMPSSGAHATTQVSLREVHFESTRAASVYDVVSIETQLRLMQRSKTSKCRVASRLLLCLAALGATAPTAFARVFVGVGVGVGVPVYGPYYGPYYYPPPVVYAPPPVVYTSPPVVMQQGSAPSQFWYWCDNPQGYHPYVSTCTTAWRQVPAVPPR
jgi:hypothetical protein